MNENAFTTRSWFLPLILGAVAFVGCKNQKSDPHATAPARLEAPAEMAEESPLPPQDSTSFTLPPTAATEGVVEVVVEGDKAVRVVHAPSPTTRAIIYLHGMCSTPNAADRWSEQVRRHGTLIMLRADIPCGDRPGFKWPQEGASIQARIDAALLAVQGARNGHLDSERLNLIGYSQGAHRAEILTGLYPERYERIGLGGPPTAAEPTHFHERQRVFVLGGELEDYSHMKRGAEALAAAGIPSRFALLPKAYHGDYGPEGPRVVGEALDWLFEP